MVQSAPGKLTRQQIYDRIRKSSKDEFILDEMIRLGFWPKEKEKPSLSTEFIKRQGELERELRELMARQRKVEDPELALKEMRKQRMAESRRRREENKVKRIEEAHEKAVAWHRRRAKEILFLGEGYSKGLNQVQNRSEKLARYNLPDLSDALSLAQAMGIELAELRFLTFTRPTSTVNHYQRFEIAKKRGGTRLISAPMPRLKRAQYWVLDNVLGRIPLPDTVHGFIADRSIVTNAQPHVGAGMVINLDLKDFFPTITYPRIKGLFQALGYSEQVATLLALLCSEPETDKVELDGTSYYVGGPIRFLPQGAPTSPAISNIVCCRMDRRLSGMAKKLGFTYSRYADDLTCSCAGDGTENLQKLLWRSRQIITAEGFTINDDKTRIMHSGRRQEVTGVVVNRKPSIERKTLKRFRALLHQIEKDGPQGKTWGRGGDIFEAIKGYANFIKMVDPGKGRKYKEQVNRILEKYAYEAARPETRPLGKHQFRSKAAAGEQPRENWWQVTEKPVPELLLPETKTKKSQAESSPEDIEAPPNPEPSEPEESATFGGLSISTHLKHIGAILFVFLGAKISPLLGLLLLALYFYLWRRR